MNQRIFKNLDMHLIALGYIPLLAWLLLLANGVGWLSPLDTTNQAIIDMRAASSIGFSIAFFLILAFRNMLPAQKTHSIGSALFVLGNLIMLIMYINIINMPPDGYDTPLVFYTYAVAAGFGFGLVVILGISFISQMHPTLISLWALSTLVIAGLLYSVIGSCYRGMAIALIIVTTISPLILFLLSRQISKTKQQRAWIIEEPISLKPAYDKELLQLLIGLSASLILWNLQMSYTFNTLILNEMYGTFSTSVALCLITILIIIIGVCTSQINKIPLRQFHLICAVLMELSVLALFFNESSIETSGVEFTLTSLTVIAYLTLILSFYFHGTPSIRIKYLSVIAGIIISIAILVLCRTEIDWVSNVFLSTTQSFIGMSSIAIIVAALALFPKSTLPLAFNDEVKKDVAQSVVAAIKPDQLNQHWIKQCQKMTEDKGLTKREGAILELIVEGYTINNISEKLFISTNTVRTHTRNIYKKLEVHSRSEIMDIVANTKLSS